MIKEYFATTLNVALSDLIVTFIRPDGDARARRQLLGTPSFLREHATKAHREVEARKLSEASTTQVTVIAYMATPEDAQAAAAALPADAAGYEALPAFSGIDVETVLPVETTAPWQLPINTVALVGIVLIVAGIVLCMNAKMQSKKKGGQGGCCTVGCCSFNAVKAWAFGQFVAVAAVLGTLFYMYSSAGTLTQVIIDIVETIVTLFTEAQNSSFLDDFTQNVPSEIIDLLQEQIDLLRLIPIAVVVPGLLAAIFMLLASACGASSARKGTYCCTKCSIVLSWLCSFLAFAFYTIFAAFAVVLAYAPPVLKENINMIGGMCVSIPANLRQTVEDNTLMISHLSPTDQAAYQPTIETIGAIAVGVEDGCGFLLDFFDAMNGLFLPGLLCVVSIIFAYFTSCTLCCATGCCTAPPADGPGFSAKGMAAV
jgi:hypothetical protein